MGQIPYSSGRRASDACRWTHHTQGWELMSQRKNASANDRRRRLIGELERVRGSKVVAYTISDRQNASAQIGDDAVRPLYDHLRALGPVE